MTPLSQNILQGGHVGFDHEHSFLQRSLCHGKKREMYPYGTSSQTWFYCFCSVLDAFGREGCWDSIRILSDDFGVNFEGSGRLWTALEESANKMGCISYFATFLSPFVLRFRFSTRHHTSYDGNSEMDFTVCYLFPTICCCIVFCKARCSNIWWGEFDMLLLLPALAFQIHHTKRNKTTYGEKHVIKIIFY